MSRIAIVTGGSRGIGKAIAEKLRNNYKVITCSRKSSDSLNNYVCDVTNPEEVRSFSDSIKEKYGNIDLLVNNAGGCAKRDYLFSEISIDEWQRIVNQNLNSVFLVTSAFYDIINPWGSIINISSTLAHTPLKGKSLYSVSKSGIETLTKNLALELAERRIRVNCVSPGPTDTDLLRQHFIKNGELDQDKYDQFSESMLLGRLVIPEDVANLVYFLSSGGSKMITGQTIAVDGGRLLKW